MQVFLLPEALHVLTDGDVARAVKLAGPRDVPVPEEEPLVAR